MPPKRKPRAAPLDQPLDLTQEDVETQVKGDAPTVKGDAPTAQAQLKKLQEEVNSLKEERDFLREQLKFALQRPSASQSSPAALPGLGRKSSSPQARSSSSSSSPERGRKKKKRTPKKRRIQTSAKFGKRMRTPEDVLHRYRAILKTFKKTRSMGTSCQRHDVDRTTIALTAIIAEVLIVGEGEIPKFTGQTLKEFAKECKEFAEKEPGLMQQIQTLKQNGELLPVSSKV